VKKAAIFLAILMIVLASGFGIFKLIKKGNNSFPSLTNPSQNKLLNLAKQEEESGEYLLAKENYQALIKQYPSARGVSGWQKRLEDLNIKLIFSPTIIPGSTEYEIKPGDTLTRIAKEFHTTIDLIAKINNIEGSNLHPGNKIKVWNAPFNVVVDKSQNILMLKSADEILKTYIVSTGVDNSTPVGTFKIVNKLSDPTWFKAGTVVPAGSPENILGTRWLGIDVPGYGIHGTTDPQNLGKQVTQGCVRMSNQEVEELYTLLPVGTEVVIMD